MSTGSTYRVKPATMLALGTGLLVLGAGVSFRHSQSAGSSGEENAATQARPPMEGSDLAKQFRGDLVGALRSRAKAQNLSQWNRSGFVPEEIFKNARAMDVVSASSEFCKALLSLNGSELATFEPAMERLENARWLPCFNAIRRRIEKHWDQSRDLLKAQAESGTASDPADSPDPLRRIEFVASTPLTGEELEAGEVALTFEGGPDPNRTSRILNILAEQDVRATFFMAGETASENSPIALKIRAEGHAIGALTWSNQSLRESDVKSGTREIEKGIQAVAAASGGPVEFFRFPLGDSRDAYLETLNQKKLIAVSWNVDSWDWKTSNPSEALEHILEQLDQKRGGILNLHDSLTQTEILLPELLRSLRLRKLVPVVLGR